LVPFLEDILMRILVVEDERGLNRVLTKHLKNNGYSVDSCEDGREAIEYLDLAVYDLVLLDVMLPGMSGWDILRYIREKNMDTSVLMLTALDSTEDKVKGLDGGADDYLTKPFETKELLARLRALGRRNASFQDGSLEYGDLSLDISSAKLTCHATGQSVRLGEKELRILEYMFSNQGQIKTREQLAVKIWGFENEAEYNNVEVYMSFTRKKLAFVGSKARIKAVRGLGYELREEDV
jgi:DNA-binding response OmpR family regulator